MCSIAKDIGIDLGTASVLVYVKGKGVVLNEPSVVAIDKNTGKLLKVGAEAQAMLGRTPGNIVAIRPLREGVISDYDMTERMLREFLRKVVGGFQLFKPRVIICVPSGITEVEERAVVDAGIQAGARRVYLIEEPVAAAIGAGIDISKPDGHMVVDIGGGVTDVAVYYRNVPRYIATIPMGAGAINNDIRTLGILERHVDSLKRKFGSAVAELAPENKMVSVKGRTAKETKDILLHNLAVVIESRARDIAEYVAQEIRDSGFGDKLAYGIVLTGGSAQLQHIDELFRRVTGMEVRIGTAEEAVDETSREKVASPAYSTAVGLLLRGAAHGDCAVTDIPRQGGAAQPAGPTIPRATPYSAGKPATGVSAAPYTPRPAAAPTPPPTTPAANAATEGAAQGAAAETAETPHRPKRGLLDKLKQKLGTRLDDFFTGSEDEEI